MPAIKCPQCKKPLNVREGKVGGLVGCPDCKHKFRVPAFGSPVSSGPTASMPPKGRGSAPAPPPMSLDAEETVQGQPLPSPPLSSRRSGPPPITQRGGRATPPPIPQRNGGWALPPSHKKSGASKKIAIALILLILLGGSGIGGYFLYEKYGKKDKTDGPSAAGTLVGKFGGIEIGSTGIKMIGVEYYTSENGTLPKILDPRDFNTNLGEIPKGSNDFDPKAFKLTVAQVGDYYEILHSKLGIPAENIHIVCSSGVLLGFNVEKDRDRNKNALVTKIQDKTGRKPEFIDARDESKYAFMGVVSKGDWDRAVLIDIGGKNIKGGGFDARGNFLDFSTDSGTNSFAAKLVKERERDNGESLRDIAVRSVDKEVKAPLLKEFPAPVDVLLKREKVYFLGGISWAQSSYTNPVAYYAEKSEYWRAIAAEDFAKFDEMVQRDAKEIKQELGIAMGDNKVWATDIDKLHNEVYKKRERLIGGAQILLAISEMFELKKDKKIFGHRLGQYAWLIGYVGVKSGQMK